MKVSLSFLSLASIASALLSPVGFSAQPAFPGAEGFGAIATGGRGGAVYHVTNLNDSGPGSFRDAVSVSGRTVVFDVGGIIRITTRVVVQPNITIAGQTAPGGGITIYGNGVSFSNASNTITRYLRVRQGINGDSGTDAIGIASGDMMIFDHVSASWGRDETFSINGAVSNVTIQDCIIGQGLLIHSAGGLMQTDGGVSILRTFYADNWMRNPKVKGVHEFTNNVVYNWGTGGAYICGDSAGQSFVNIINNYFSAGPDTAGEPAFIRGNLNFHAYAAGNIEDANLDGVANGVVRHPLDYTVVDPVGTPFAYPAVATLLTAQQAFDHVIAYAGASHRRDSVDAFMITEVLSHGTVGNQIFNESEVGGVGTIAGGLAPADTDGDGMPDWWEEAAGTGPAVADNNGDIDGDGYTNLENYLNALVVAGVPVVEITGISTDTGTSSTDGVTSDNTLVLAGVAPAGATVTIRRVDTGVVGTTTADGSGAWTFDYTDTVLPDRYYAFTATATTGPVVSLPSTAFAVRVDTAPAAAPSITSLVTSPEVAFNGTAAAFDSVTVRLADGTVVATTIADGLGNWVATYTGDPLTPGVYSFTASAVDLAGNAGGDSAAYTVDTSLAPPVFTGIVSDTGISGSDEITTDGTLILNGTAPVDATVAVTRAGFGPVGSAVANSSGVWSLDTTGTTLPHGVYTFTATASVSGTSSPASMPFVVNVDTTRPSIPSLVRFDPTTASTSSSTLVFRVTWNEAVVNFDVGDLVLTMTGAGMTGTISMVTTVTPAVYDVTVTGAGGDGTIRLDRRSTATVQDLAGNVPTGGFTGGQSYTMRLPGSGVWINSETGGPWSNAANWDGGLIPDVSGATADFSTLDLAEDLAVLLDTPRTVGRLVFGDVDQSSPASWFLTDGGASANTLTLASIGAPTIQVIYTGAQGDSNATIAVAGAAAPAVLDVNLASSTGLSKLGWGTALLARLASLSGSLAVTEGYLKLGPGGSLTVPAPNATTGVVTVGTSAQLQVDGGTFTTPGTLTISNGGSSGVQIYDGTANIARITTTGDRDGIVKVTGGVANIGEIALLRSSNSESEAASFTRSGFLILGGQANVGTLTIPSGNSWSAVSVEGGELNVSGPATLANQVTSGRGGLLRVTGGRFTVTEPTDGLVLSKKNGTNANNVAKVTLLGGLSALEKLTLGYAADVNAGSASVTLDGGALYLGAGGLEKRGVAPFVATVTLTSGVLGANADWGTSVPLTLAGSPEGFAIHAAGESGAAHDIMLNAALTGTGGFAKTGAGRLGLAGTHAFTGGVAVNAGVLEVDGSIGAGTDVAVNAGGILSGDGAMSRAVALNSGGTVMPGNATAGSVLTVDTLTWNSDGALAYDLDATSNQLAVIGAFTRGGDAPHPFVFNAGPGVAIGNIYTLVTFGSTDFTAADFSFDTLAPGLTGGFFVGANDVTFKVYGPPIILQTPQNTAVRLGGTATFTVSVGESPTLDYQWFKDGVAISGATSGSLVISNVQGYDLGSYHVVVTNRAGSTSSASATLEIVSLALLNRGPSLNSSTLEGSIQQMLGTNAALNGDMVVTGDLRAPGLPTVVLNGTPNYSGTIDATGATTPTGYTITLNSGTTLAHVVRRTDAVSLPVALAPVAPTGTRSVTLNHASQSAGDWATLRNLTLNQNAGQRAVPAGAYGTFAASGSAGFILGVADATTPSVYYFQSLTLNGSAQVQVVGPVVVVVANGFSVNGATMGSAANPGWLTLHAHGNLSLNSQAHIHGYVIAPTSQITINNRSEIVGGLASDRLTLNSDAVLELLGPAAP